LKEPDDNSASGGSEDIPEGAQRPILGLSIPHQTAPKADNLLLDLRETEAWFEALPMANVGETARQVYKTLVEFNRVAIPDPLRVKIVEKFRPPVEYITNNLLKYYIDTGLPLSQKGTKTASLARELQKELAISYKIIAQRIISGDNPSFDRRLLVVAMHRALHYIGETLLQNALVYYAWPVGIWREINSIFAYASQNKIHQIPVKPDDKASKANSTTIEDQFKALMLFASATPHRLRQSHASLLYTKLNDWAQYTSIPDTDDGGTSLGRFNVDLWTDAAPMHNSLRTPLPGKRMAVLDVRELLKKLRADFEEAPWDSRGGLQSGKPVVTRPLLRLLIMAWSRPPDRRFVRTRLNFELHVVAGLHAIYGNLSAEETPPYETTRAAVFSMNEAPIPQPGARRKIDWSAGELEKATLSPLDSDFVTDSLLSESVLSGKKNTLTTSALNEFADDGGQKSIEQEPSSAPQPVKTVNESAGGYCIRWKGQQIPRVKIGELVGVESPSDRRTYGLGVIRWMKQLADHELDIGLEVVATRCQAGDVREVAKTSPRNRLPSFKCLLINNTDPNAQASASLVMSAMTLQTGVDLWLATGGKEQMIRLTKLVEFSSAFARYLFEFVNNDADQDGDEHVGDEFDELWSSL
jgi:hypothetical protein